MKRCRAAKSLVLDELPPIVGAETAWALASIHADAGRTAEAVAVAEAGYAIAVRCSDAPHMRFNIADAHVGALLLAGRIGEALEVAEWARGQAADLPGTAHLLGPAIAGRAALGAGRLDEACALLEQAAGALAATGYAMGWGYRYGVPRATALAMSGRVDEAAAVLDELETVARPFRSLDYEKSVARAWVAAGQGAVSEAIGILRSAAERAASDERFAAEVVCLQTAAQFGDRSCEERLRELEEMVEGPRVGLGGAVRGGDARGRCRRIELRCQRVSRRWAMGWRRWMRRRRRRWRIGGRTCGGRRWDARRGRKRWRRRCGADTPTLRQAREPLPLTDREREIVLLLGRGSVEPRCGGATDAVGAHRRRPHLSGR